MSSSTWKTNQPFKQINYKEYADDTVKDVLRWGFWICVRYSSPWFFTHDTEWNTSWNNSEIHCDQLNGGGIKEIGENFTKIFESSYISSEKKDQRFYKCVYSWNIKKNSQILTVYIGLFLSLHSRKLNWLKIKETRKPLWEKEDYDTIYICTFNDISVYSID